MLLWSRCFCYATIIQPKPIHLGEPKPTCSAESKEWYLHLLSVFCLLQTQPTISGPRIGGSVKVLYFFIYLFTFSNLIEWTRHDLHKQKWPFQIHHLCFFHNDPKTACRSSWHVNCFPTSWWQKRPKRVPVQKIERLPSDSIGRRRKERACQSAV